MLTHLPLDKKAAILADDMFNCIFLNINDEITIPISLKYVRRSPINNTWALVKKIAWRRTGDKPLPEPMMTQFIDAYVRHQGEMSYSIIMLEKFLTSANQKHRIWSCDESGLCNPRPHILGDEFVAGPSLMFRKMDPWNVIRIILQDKSNKNQL